MTPEDIERLIKEMQLPAIVIAAISRDIRLTFYAGIENIEKIINQNILEVNPKVLEHLQNYTFDLVKGMNEDLANKLRDSLRRGMMEGQNSKVIAKDIQKIFETTKTRAEMIARTETARAYNYGSIEAAKASPVELVKYYSAVHDSRTSPLCTRLSNKYNKEKAIAIDKDFIDVTSGWRGLYPPAHVNCRSEAIYIPKKT